MDEPSKRTIRTRSRKLKCAAALSVADHHRLELHDVPANRLDLLRVRHTEDQLHQVHVGVMIGEGTVYAIYIYAAADTDSGPIIVGERALSPVGR